MSRRGLDFESAESLIGASSDWEERLERPKEETCPQDMMGACDEVLEAG